jgi:cytochrome P450
VPLLFARKYPEKFKDGIIYLDNWPFAPPMLAVFEPDMMAQFTQETSLPKHEMMHAEFMPFTQLNDLVLQEGQVWKMWRSIFNPGFSSKNLMSFVPDIIEEVDVFKQWLRSIAKTGEVAKFVHPSMKLTIDVIGRVTL